MEALFANTAGNLCECTGSNVFVVVDGEILTPDLGSGPLAGITRELVIQWCREEGLTVRAEPLPMSILGQAEEVFITSSTKDVMAVHSVDDRSMHAGGPVTVQAAEIFVCPPVSISTHEPATAWVTTKTSPWTLPTTTGVGGARSARSRTLF